MQQQHTFSEKFALQQVTEKMHLRDILPPIKDVFTSVYDYQFSFDYQQINTNHQQNH